MEGRKAASGMAAGTDGRRLGFNDGSRGAKTPQQSEILNCDSFWTALKMTIVIGKDSVVVNDVAFIQIYQVY